LEENRPVRLVDDVPDGVRRLAMNELEAGHDLWREVFSAMRVFGRTNEHGKLLAPVFNAGASPTANQSPIAEMGACPRIFAYQCFTTATMLVDGCVGNF